MLNENWGAGYSDLKNAQGRAPFKQACDKCGARRIDSQIGLESTIESYVATMVEVFGLVREVMADDATLWLNLGDSYASGNGHGDFGRAGVTAVIGTTKANVQGRAPIAPGLKPKDLCGIPWRVAFALQADGWYLRQDIIWAKPNPMPESVGDRCTRSHEYLFLLSKRPTYFFDAEAIRETSTKPAGSVSVRSWQYSHETSDPKGGGMRGTGGLRERINEECRNRRSVWTIPTQPYAEAHFATFPPKLIEPAILAGTSTRGHCPAPGCGKRWVRVCEVSYSPANHGGTSLGVISTSDKQDLRESSEGTGNPGFRAKVNKDSRTLTWHPTCTHNLDPVPDVCLDPFHGAGTVGVVCERLGRDWLGIELNERYVKLQEGRMTGQVQLALW